MLEDEGGVVVMLILLLLGLLTSLTAAADSHFNPDDILARELFFQPRFRSSLGSFRTLALLNLLRGRLNPRNNQAEILARLDAAQRLLNDIKFNPLGGGVSGVTQPPANPPVNQPTPTPNPNGGGTGEQLFQQCLECHTKEQKRGKTAEEIKQAIATKDPMKKFSSLSDADIDAIAQYLSN